MPPKGSKKKIQFSYPKVPIDPERQDSIKDVIRRRKIEQGILEKLKAQESDGMDTAEAKESAEAKMLQLQKELDEHQQQKHKLFSLLREVLIVEEKTKQQVEQEKRRSEQESRKKEEEKKQEALAQQPVTEVVPAAAQQNLSQAGFAQNTQDGYNYQQAFAAHTLTPATPSTPQSAGSQWGSMPNAIAQSQLFPQTNPQVPSASQMIGMNAQSVVNLNPLVGVSSNVYPTTTSTQAVQPAIPPPTPPQAAIQHPSKKMRLENASAVPSPTIPFVPTPSLPQSSFTTPAVPLTVSTSGNIPVPAQPSMIGTPVAANAPTQMPSTAIPLQVPQTGLPNAPYQSLLGAATPINPMQAAQVAQVQAQASGIPVSQIAQAARQRAQVSAHFQAQRLALIRARQMGMGRGGNMYPPH